MSFKKESYALQAESLIRRFNRRGMEACYCEDSKAAVEKVLSLIPDGSSVTWGGSATFLKPAYWKRCRTAPMS